MKNYSILFILFLYPFLGVGQNPTLSDGWYRIPYLDGTNVKITRDWVDHGSNGGNERSMDMIDVDGVGIIVAAADGKVQFVKDDRRDCGCHSSYGDCSTNFILIYHLNGEFSNYRHIAFNSAVVVVNQVVTAGQIIATEGDVGNTCGNTRAANNLGNTCPSVEVDSATDCGRHLHFTITRGGNYLNPRICSPDVVKDYFIFEDDETYVAAPCGLSTCGVNNWTFLNQTFDGVMRSYPAMETISTVDDVIIDNTEYTSIDFQAGDRIILSPGFHAKSGTFFRSSIRACENNTLQIPENN